LKKELNMSSGTVPPLSSSAHRCLGEICGDAPRRSTNVRALAAFAQNAGCPLANLAFAAGVDLDRLLVGTHFQTPFGQSPFAFQRGLTFEASLRKNGYAATLDLLRAALNDPLSSPVVVSLRDQHSKDRAGMMLRWQDTRELLRRIVGRDPGAPNLIDGAVLRGEVGGLEAFFEADALAARARGAIRVAEVKSFPKVDGRVDADKLGTALDQVGIYLLLLRRIVAELGGDPAALVSDEGLLITPRNVGLQPTLSVKGVGPRIARAEQVLAAVPRVADVIAAAPLGRSFGPVADRTAEEPRRLHALEVLADEVGTAYKPGCLASCGNARFCRSRARCKSEPALLGSTAARLMPGITTLSRAEELSRGLSPTGAEAPAAALLAGAGRLYDEAAGATGGTATAV
jgi:hypothetical protein